jgi:3-hydroxyacyl-[acyl-carrier-protein] dehydratase
MRCLLVDKIIGYESRRSITGIKNVTMSENFLEDHFPDFPVMPGVLQLESIVQLGAWLVFASSDGRCKARLRDMQSVKFKDFVVPGDQMRIELAVVQWDEHSCLCDAKIFAGDGLKTDVRRIALAHVPTEQLEDPAAARRYFDFISGAAPRGGYSS